MLTVKSLVESLKNFSEDLRIVVPGYEGGFNDVSSVEEITLALNVHKEDYYGNHEIARDVENIDKAPIENVICLSGYHKETTDKGE